MTERSEITTKLLTLIDPANHDAAIELIAELWYDATEDEKYNAMMRHLDGRD